MIQFKSLRLSGFKSFVDKTEMEIGPGLNGIVGPNGCGKSNLVEALRWVMGESSAKRMRGSGMEDVIFAGTDKRSARNLAEVSLLLDNATRTAPSIYNATDEIEVVRRIERDKGSDYRINGKSARARDVQMLFADTVTGSNSPSLVSQGHVTRMINAKPQDRRLILEESAGIAGLYARRHEAELRLKAADANLVRVEDIIGSMDSRLSTLKRQARQATKYKNLNAQIRQFEIVITYLEWRALIERQKENHKRFAEAESIVAEKLAVVSQLTKTQTTQAEELPALRKAEAELGAALQTHKLALQRLEDENARRASALQEAKDQLHQAKVDSQHEEKTIHESSEILEKIQIEHTELSSLADNEGQKKADLAKRKETLHKDVIALEERFTALKESAAETRARQSALEEQIKNNENRLTTLQNRKEKARQEHETLQINDESKKNIAELESLIETMETERSDLSAKTDNVRESIQRAEDKANALREGVNESQNAYTAFLAEIRMLESFFNNTQEQNFTPVLDDISTESGFEKSLSRALGDCLMASIDKDAPAFWIKHAASEQKPPALPEGISSLLPHVDAPEELDYALSQIGYIEETQDGHALALQLNPGQSLVSKNGTYWRWDGYVVKEDATDRHSVYLEQKNKLAELEKKRSAIEVRAVEAQKDLDGAIQDHKNAKDAYSNLLAEIKTIEKKLADSRPALGKLRERTAKNESEIARLNDLIHTTEEDIKVIQETLNTDKTTLKAMISSRNEEQENTIEDIRLQLTDKKNEFQESVRILAQFEQQQSTRSARLQAIADERISLQNRSIRAKEHLKTLTQRITGLEEKLSSLKTQPQSFEKEHEALLSKIAEKENARTQAANRLAECETEVTNTGKAMKEAESILGDAREERAHAQATLSAINEQLKNTEESILETIGVEAKDLPAHAAVDLVKYQNEDLEKLKQEKDKLTREREAIGPVNLQADSEMQELEQEVTGLLHERNDLIQAIGELRGGIDKINKEARERLNTAFNHVNAHFQHLFTRLFKGGKAHLQLIESEDPLGAGLEIFAQPPGKALQSLSLLSGGEQTLASIALIFAMFLTNPSPICVLDEIDAPLDDANVDRVCDLLEEIAERGETRFLVITHHRLSMARMDRLYGVTMSEKGVSQLVSVDIQQSFEFIDQHAA